MIAEARDVDNEEEDEEEEEGEEEEEEDLAAFSMRSSGNKPACFSFMAKATAPCWRKPKENNPPVMSWSALD